MFHCRVLVFDRELARYREVAEPASKLLLREGKLLLKGMEPLAFEDIDRLKCIGGSLQLQMKPPVGRSL